MRAGKSVGELTPEGQVVKALNRDGLPAYQRLDKVRYMRPPCALPDGLTHNMGNMLDAITGFCDEPVFL